MTRVDPANLAQAIANTRAHLLSLRNAAGHWEGHLSSSALSTATAVVALHTVDARAHAAVIARGAEWLNAHQNADGGWGDTTLSKSNLSTTLLCWSALHLGWHTTPSDTTPSDRRRDKSIDRANHWIANYVGSLDPEAIADAVVARYGKDKTFSVPILMLCSICGTLGEGGWHRVLPLPFELAAFPRVWFGAIGLPVVSYALPALIAIGYTRFFHAPPAKWNPLRWLRAALWPRISPMLKTLQPSSGGYLEATPLTSFVTMALASADEKHHPCVPVAVEFLLRSQREDGSWAIDTNLATWGTTLSVKALVARQPSGARQTAEGSPKGEAGGPNHSDVGNRLTPQGLDIGMSSYLKSWLLRQQYREVHPFTNAAPGGWAWTDLPGGVPDADDTSSAIVALWHLCESDDERRAILPQIEAGITWLLDLQNRDGGMPTFCRGWGALPFDRSTPEITAHALWAFAKWHDHVDVSLQARMAGAITTAMRYLQRTQRPDGSWHPLWFGNEHTHDEENPVHGTAMVLQGFSHLASLDEGSEEIMRKAAAFLLGSQQDGGGWGGSININASIEETANAINAISAWLSLGKTSSDIVTHARESVARGVAWLLEHTHNGTHFPAAPIGLYFARLWYHEELYPVIWTLGALQQAFMALNTSPPDRIS
jgi:squalene-hopene/tetraprenyl-beta-curcumene cyclase